MSETEEEKSRKGSDSKLHTLCEDMCGKVGSYVDTEVAAVCDDFGMLETMNKSIIDRYAEMQMNTVSIGNSMLEINEKYGSLVCFFEQIEKLESSIQNLETVATQIDTYTKKLELRFKELEKRQTIGLKPGSSSTNISATSSTSSLNKDTASSSSKDTKGNVKEEGSAVKSS